MKQYKILMLVGKDRPGIVDEVSTLLYDHGANIEDSRMAALGGCFSIMALFSCSGEELKKISTGLKAMEAYGFHTSLHDAQDPLLDSGHAALPLHFEIQAMDHPGIVQKVVHLLHGCHVNIRSLDTKVSHAPISGSPLFDLILSAEVPMGTSIAKIKSALTSLAEEQDLNLIYLP